MISEKNLDVERDNRNRIYLHKERLFWVAYEHSAYMFINKVRIYQVQKRTVKTLNRDVVSIAFPDAVIKDIKLSMVRQTDDLIVFRVPGKFDEQRFDQWRADIPLFVRNHGRRHEFISTVPTASDRVLKRVRDFDPTYSTPIDCMNFLVEMKRQLA